MALDRVVNAAYIGAGAVTGLAYGASLAFEELVVPAVKAFGTWWSAPPQQEVRRSAAPAHCAPAERHAVLRPSRALLLKPRAVSASPPLPPRQPDLAAPSSSSRSDSNDTNATSSSDNITTISAAAPIVPPEAAAPDEATCFVLLRTTSSRASSPAAKLHLLAHTSSGPSAGALWESVPSCASGPPTGALHGFGEDEQQRQPELQEQLQEQQQQQDQHQDQQEQDQQQQDQQEQGQAGDGAPVEKPWKPRHRGGMRGVRQRRLEAARRAEREAPEPTAAAAVPEAPGPLGGEQE
jgi:hypothetical protein